MVVVSWSRSDGFTWLALLRHWFWESSIFCGHWEFYVRDWWYIQLVLINSRMLRLHRERVLSEVLGESTFYWLSLYLLPRRLKHLQFSRVKVLKYKPIVRLFRMLFEENGPMVRQALVWIGWSAALPQPANCLFLVDLRRVNVFKLRLNCSTSRRSFLVSFIFTWARPSKIMRYFCRGCII